MKCCCCCCCCSEGKTGEPRKKILSEQSIEPAKSIHIYRRVRNRTRVTLVKGECSVLNLKHRLLFWGELVHVGVDCLVCSTFLLFVAEDLSWKFFFFQTSPEWQQVHDSCRQKMDITVFKLPSITWLPWWSRCRAWSCMESHSWLLDIWSWHEIVTQWPGSHERAVKHQQWHGTYCQRVHWLANYTALSIEGILAYHSIGISRFSVGWLFSLSFGRKLVVVV